MAVKLSRQPGLFSVLLCRTAWPDVGKLAPALATRLGITRSDAVRALRLQRGILFEGMTAAQAEAAAGLLRDEGTDCRVVPDLDVPGNAKPLEVSLARVGEDFFETPSLQGPGLPQLWGWENLLLVAGGLILDAKTQAEKLTSGLENGLLHEAEVRKAQAQRQLERSRQRLFPLSTEIRREEPQLAEALATAHRARQARTKGEAVTEPAAEGEFGKVHTRLDLFFEQPFERLRITELTHIQDLQRSTLPAKQLHLLAAALSARASAKMTHAAAALASGADSGEYLFDDAHQFDDYCRWSLWLRTAPQ